METQEYIDPKDVPMPESNGPGWKPRQRIQTDPNYSRILSVSPLRIELTRRDKNGKRQMRVISETNKPLPESERCLSAMPGSFGLLRCNARKVPGGDVCRTHGGAAIKEKVRLGQVSPEVAIKYGDTIAKRAEELRNDPQLLDIAHRVALRLAMLEHLMGMIDEQPSRADLEHIFDFHRQVDDAVVKDNKIRFGEHYTLNMEGVMEVTSQFIAVIQRQVNLCPHCGESLEEIKVHIADGLRQVIHNQSLLPQGE